LYFFLKFVLGKTMSKMGKIIKSNRKEYGISRRKLAYILGVSVSTISHWENGRRIPKVSNLLKIINVLNITIDLDDLHKFGYT